MRQLGKRIVGGLLAAALAAASLGAADGAADIPVFRDVSITASAAGVYVGTPSMKKSYSATASSVTVSWSKVSGASGYRVYRQNPSTKKYVKIKTLYGADTLSYKNTGLSSAQKYSYKVKAFVKKGGSTYWSGSSAANYVCTAPSAKPSIKSISSSGGGLKLKWNKVKCSGYEIYGYSYYTGKWTLIKKPSASATSATIYPDSREYGGLSGYKFKIKAYSKDASGGVKKTASTTADTYYSISEVAGSMSSDISRLNGAKRTSRSAYKMYNTQGKKTTESTQYLTNADKAAIERFAKEHFESGWTPAQKAAYTLNWINKNVTYASGGSYYTIASMGYAEAIFDHKLGQCLQYNGAMVEMLTYLGYDASLIWGYRGTSQSNRWQHFWGEIKIGGVSCVIETGNYGQSGDWWYLCTPYSQAGKYIKNNAVVTH